MALDPVAVALKFGFLAVLYLFLLWVVRSALKDLRRANDAPAVAASPAAADPMATGLHSASRGFAAPHLEGEDEPYLYVDRAAGHEAGSAYRLGDLAIFGRGDEVDIRLEDPFASTRHARIVRQGEILVIEDLGSTNGTFLNDEPLQGPQPLHSGDRIRIGSSEFSYRI